MRPAGRTAGHLIVGGLNSSIPHVVNRPNHILWSRLVRNVAHKTASILVFNIQYASVWKGELPYEMLNSAVIFKRCDRTEFALF